MAKRILCVIRTSTKYQNTESQHKDMLEFLTSRGLGYTEDEIEWLESAGASAKQVNQKYLDMLDRIKTTIKGNPSITAAAFWHLNRLGRWENYIVDMKVWFITNHIQVYVKTPNLTLFDKNGNLDNGANIAWGVFASLVSYDTQEMTEKVKRGKDYIRNLGLYDGRPLKYGFKVDSTRHVVVDLDAMVNIKTMYLEYSTGNYSIVKLQKEFRSRGIEFTEIRIQRILSLTDYRPLVGEELWDKVKAIRDGITAKNVSKESKNHNLALGLIKCKCGANYCADGNYYVCYTKKAPHRFAHKCSDSVGMNVKVMDTILYDLAMLAYKSELETIDYSQISRLSSEKAIIYQKIDTAEKNLLKVSDKRSRAAELYTELQISKSQYQKMTSRATAEYIEIQAALEILHSELERIEESINLAQHSDIQNWIDLAVASTNELPKEKVRQLVKKYLRRITLESVVLDDTKATKIMIEDSQGQIHTYFYKQNFGRKPVFTEMLLELDPEGKLVPYLDSPEFSNRTEYRRKLYLEAKNREVPE